MRSVTASRPRVSERSFLVAAAVVGVAYTVAMVVRVLQMSIDADQIDLAVFQDAGRAYLDGNPLYSDEFPTRSGLRFIYAPIAAVLFAPMAWIGTAPLQVLWAAVNIAAVWWVLAMVLRRLDVVRPHLVAVAALGFAIMLEPVRSNFAFGQVNILLMLLVVADCTGHLPRRLRGVGAALAASIKITPAAFGLYFLVKRDYAAIVRAAVTVAVVAGVGFALLPGESKYFWLTEFFQTERAGGHDFVRNQAITGILARLGAEGTLKDVLWLAAAVTVVIAAAWSARRFVLSGERVVAFSIVALASLLAAPFAVTHHWVYVVLLVPLAIAPRYRSWSPMLIGAFAVFAWAPYAVIDDIDDTTSVPKEILLQIVGNSQCLVGIALMVAAVVQARRRTPAPVELEPPVLVDAR